MIQKTRSILDLQHFTDVLKDVSYHEPVFLSENGHVRYVLMDIAAYETAYAKLELLGELMKGEQSAKESGWLDFDDVEKRLGIRHG